jgi:hypothetical protein
MLSCTVQEQDRQNTAALDNVPQFAAGRLYSSFTVSGWFSAQLHQGALSPWTQTRFLPVHLARNTWFLTANLQSTANILDHP